MNIRDYLNEYLRITRSCILSPGTFFNEINIEEKRYLKPLAYALISMAVYSAGSSILFLLLPHYASRDMIAFNIIIFIGFFISSIILIFILVLAEHIAGGKKSFNLSFNVVCYSSSVLNVSWIFFVSLALVVQYGSRLNGMTQIIMLYLLLLFVLLWLDTLQYIFYLLVTGVSVVSGISKLRAFAAIAFSILILLALITSGSYLLHELSDKPQPSKPPYLPPYQGIQRHNLTAYLGSAPVIDGTITDSDRWYEGVQIEVNARGKNYIITTKHDRENLYILIQLNGTSEWKDKISINFEQDDGKPDSNLSTGLVDRYYQGYDPDPSVVGTGLYKSYSGYSGKHLEGFLKVGYSGVWVMEWKIPLNSGDKDNIFVDRYPAVLGFSIINEREGEGGILPPAAYRSDPRTWATLNIVDTKKP